MKNEYSEITPYIRKLAELSNRSNGILPEMYAQHKVNRGLRDLNGNGVVTGLTEISNIKAKEKAPDGTDIPCKGELFYRGINVGDLVQGFLKDRRLGFEEAVYLLLFSELPDTEQLARFRETLSDYRSLPTSFVRDMILKAPGKDMMNILSRSVLALYASMSSADCHISFAGRLWISVVSALPSGKEPVYSFAEGGRFYGGMSFADFEGKRTIFSS